MKSPGARGNIRASAALMPLTPGTRLGAYEIVTAIGAGGIGGVYRARDRKLDRDVALKILPEALATDPERIARFAREANAIDLNLPPKATLSGFSLRPDGKSFATGTGTSRHDIWLLEGLSQPSRWFGRS